MSVLLLGRRVLHLPRTSTNAVAVFTKLHSNHTSYDLNIQVLDSGKMNELNKYVITVTSQFVYTSLYRLFRNFCEWVVLLMVDDTIIF